MGGVNKGQNVPVSPVLPKVPAAGTGEHSGQRISPNVDDDGKAARGDVDAVDGSDAEPDGESNEQFENEPEDGREL